MTQVNLDQSSYQILKDIKDELTARGESPDMSDAVRELQRRQTR